MKRTSTLAAALISIALLCGIAVMINYVAARHFKRLDWTGAHMYSVSDKTRDVLGRLDRDVKVTVFMIPSGRQGANDAYDFTQELLEQFKRYAGGHLTVEVLDVDKQRDEVVTLARKYGIDGEDLRDGVVVFESGGKTKYVTKSELVEYDYRESAMGEDQKMRSYKGEGAFVSALLTVTEGTQTQICFAKGHGESDPDNYEDDGYSAFAEALKRDNYKTKAITGLGKSGVPKDCDVVVVGGPQRAWEQTEIDALSGWLDGGGKAFLLLGPSYDEKVTRWVKTGLEGLTEKWGIHLGENLVLDPEGAIMTPLEWATDAYGDHPIVKKLAGKPTIWPAAREVRGASELVRSSKDGWGETSLAVFRREEPARFDAATDVKGPVPVAAAAEKKGRLVVFGTPEVVGNFRLKGDRVRDYNVDLALSAVAWLAKKEQLVAIGPKQPEHIKLTLTDKQLSSAFWMSVLGLPLIGITLGGCVWWRRRS